MHSSSTLYEITFPDGRTERRRKIGLAEQAAIATAFQFGDRLVVTIWTEPGEHDNGMTVCGGTAPK